MQNGSNEVSRRDLTEICGGETLYDEVQDIHSTLDWPMTEEAVRRTNDQLMNDREGLKARIKDRIKELNLEKKQLLPDKYLRTIAPSQNIY